MGDKHFAEKLKQKRKEKKLSQEQLAYVVSVSQGEVCNWEKAEHYPAFPTAIKLSMALEWDVSDMIDKSIIKIETL